MCERVFSLVQHFWNDKKSQLHIDTLKDWLAVKYNLSMTCLEIAEFIRPQRDILKKVQSIQKYNIWIIFFLTVFFYINKIVRISGTPLFSSFRVQTPLSPLFRSKKSAKLLFSGEKCLVTLDITNNGFIYGYFGMLLKKTQGFSFIKVR